jgi:hypothetical protein
LGDISSRAGEASIDALAMATTLWKVGRSF